ncbi:MAG: DUF1554 domain-containing protein [Spirochaetia bacterium]|nr:DUF1554 domain-containing protein [Spirochaetia bacterium]
METFRYNILIALASVCLTSTCAERFPVSQSETTGPLAAILLANVSSSSSGPCKAQGLCYIFATAGAWLGDLGGSTGIAGADARCMSDGNKPTSGTYKAMLGDGSTRIATTTADVGDGQVGWVLYASATYRRPDGLSVMTTGTNKLFPFGALTNPIANSGTYHTGFNTGWVTNAHCNQWSDGSGGAQGRYGTGGSTSQTTITLSQTACNTTTRGIYCAEQ